MLNTSAKPVDFLDELETEKQSLIFWGRANYFTSHIIGWLIILSSLIAGAGGLAKLIDPIVVEIVALFPAALVFLSQRQKFGARANWYYRKFHALRCLQAEVKYEGLSLTAASAKRRDLNCCSGQGRGYQMQSCLVKRTLRTKAG